MSTLSSSKARGLRLTLARKMIGLTRNAFERKYQLSASTIQSWEGAKAGGLTVRGANKILPMLRKEGLSCTAEWLLHGIGNPPQLFTNSETTWQNHNTPPEDQAIIQELLLFRQLHTNTLDMKVGDDGMLPYFKAGEYVAGVCHSIENIETLNGADCIVRTEENHILLRRIRHIQQNMCDLICINPDSTVPLIVLYNQRITQVAPVLWHRKIKNV